MTQRVRQVWQAIGSFLTPQPGVCVQCHRAVGFIGGICAHLPKEGIDLEFCSQYCADNYWKDYKKYCMRTAGRSLCSLPGCNKPCYQEGYKTHDYCGRTHAKEHKAMMEAMERDRRKQHYGGWGSGLGGSSFSSGSSRRNGPIKFYNRGEPYYEFTNFYEVVIVIDGEHWPTSEHYFQSQKFVGTPIVETIRMLSRPREAFDLSRDPRYSRWRRPDWEEVKEDVMYKALQAKFSQHKNLRQKLLETGERKLIEHSPHDSYWGDGGDGTGKNRLGALLMKLRDEMKAKKKEIRPSSSPHSVPKHHGALDKEPIAGLAIEPSSKPAGQSYARQVQGGSSGGAGPCGQTGKPDSSAHDHKQLQEYGHAHRGHSPASNTDSSPHTRATGISDAGAATQPTTTTTQSYLVTFSPSTSTPAATTTTNATQSSPSLLKESMPNQQMLHAQTVGISGFHVPQNPQVQQIVTPGNVTQAYGAMGPPHMTQWSTSHTSPAVVMSSGVTALPGTSQQPTQHGGLIELNPALAGTPGYPSPQNQNLQPQGCVQQPSSAVGSTYMGQWNTGQPVFSGAAVTTMSQQCSQYHPTGIGHSNSAPLGQFPQSQYQQPVLTQAPVLQPSGAMGSTHMVQWNASQPVSNVALSSSTATTNMSQQHNPMGTRPAPPPGFSQLTGGTHFAPATSTNQFGSNVPIHVEQREPFYTPTGAHPPYLQGSGTVNPLNAHGVAGGASAQSSFQSGQQQATLHQSQQNRPGNNGPDEPMDTSYI